MATQFKNPDILYKFGVTHFVDAIRRFSKGTAMQYGFVNEELTDDYVPVPVLSRWVPKDTARRLEEKFKKDLPKNVWTTKKYNGITECRYLTQEEADEIRDNLDRMFPKPKYAMQRNNYIKIYFCKFIKKELYEKLQQAKATK